MHYTDAAYCYYYYYYYYKCQDLGNANHKKLRGTLHKLTN